MRFFQAAVAASGLGEGSPEQGWFGLGARVCGMDSGHSRPCAWGGRFLPGLALRQRGWGGGPALGGKISAGSGGATLHLQVTLAAKTPGILPLQGRAACAPFCHQASPSICPPTPGC